MHILFGTKRNLCKSLVVVIKLFFIHGIQQFYAYLSRDCCLFWVRHTINGNYTREHWIVHRLTMMQWSNLTKCGLFFNTISPAVHTLLLSVLQHLDSQGIEALILILEKTSTADMTLSSVRYCFPAKWGFFILGNKSSQMVPNQRNYGR